jgi:hypothetical protein
LPGFARFCQVFANLTSSESSRMYVFLFAWMLFIVNVFYICACTVVCFFHVCTNVCFLIRARMFVFLCVHECLFFDACTNVRFFAAEVECSIPARVYMFFVKLECLNFCF